jgi:legumain
LIGLLVLVNIGLALGANWAVIVAGSNYFYNYRHQTDCCHAFQILVKNGVPADNIITMLYNDIANDPQNPFPGKLFNKPTDQGTPGVDVYDGCQVDYSGDDVTAANFLNILRGNATAMQGIGNGKVLQSTSTDNVFVNFVDHGATGLVAFPAGPYLYANDLADTLKYMHDQSMYAKLVFYLEACESGSMFDGLLPEDYNIYATTASNPDESSWGTYCPPDDMVNGVAVGSCLGDLYSVNWMEDADADPDMKETLQQQFVNVVNLTTESHVMQYGTLDYTTDPIGDFEGAESKKKSSTLHRTRKAKASPSSSMVQSYDAKMHSLYYKYLRTPTGDMKSRLGAAHQLQKELQHRMDTDMLFMTLAHSAVPESEVDKVLFGAVKKPVRCGTCCRSLHEAIRQRCGPSDYGMQYSRAVVNLCSRVEASNDLFAPAKLISHVERFCGRSRSRN